MNQINCIIVDDEPIAREILESFLVKLPNFFLIKSCKNAMEAFEVLNNQKIDLLFLDINMPDVSGLSLAKTVNKNSKIIFTTAHREYALEGFDLKAIDYLLKPISFDRFLQSIKKYYEISPVIIENVKEHKNDSSFIFIRSNRKMIKIVFHAILYIESLSDYIKIHQKDRVVVTRETISNIEVKLPNKQFLRVHRSYIVNLNEIDSYTNEFVEIDKKAISISRTFKENVLKKLNEI